MKFNEFLSLIESKKLDKITLILGEEHFYLRNIMEMLNKIYGENRVNIMHGEDVKIEKVKEELETQDMFSDQNIILLIDPEKVKDIDKLSKNFKKRNKLTNNLLLYSYQKYLNVKKKPYKFIDKKSILKFKKIYKNKLHYLIRDYVKEHGKKMKRDAIDYFIERNEDNVEIIFKELDKLLIFVAGKKTIKIEDIEKLSGNFARINVFSILDNLRNQNKTQFYSSLEYILKEKDTYEILGILKLLYTELKKILTVKNNLNLQNNQIANKINLHPYVFKKNNYRACAKNISYSKIKNVIKKLTDADLTLKLGGDPYTVFHNLFLDFF
ncbi:MAG: DNA polymerase III subunit delta [Candidatus Mcinerneyibacterium aminivorans]|jgi:DNA polymerase-3 subunit delta|uniref:DNA-directed DNA polymerase n=1 Tax=Candidatus Mcinerneyibacterium aminivorans TaxID=2703815 RepID=A0A5D0MFM3_9BACT|nr:MAG: DNA polymerase III subunit delta [Candidatus Mcinerneyibacterium aminivorans]